LAPVYGWFTEGFDTLDLKEAKALLEELGTSVNGADNSVVPPAPASLPRSFIRSSTGQLKIVRVWGGYDPLATNSILVDGFPA
jgi:hypothetical protein